MAGRVKRCLMATVLTGVLLLQGVTVQAATVNLPSGVASDEVGAEIEGFVQEHDDTTAGMSVSIFRQNETIYTSYFGYVDKEAGKVVNQDTVMEWGSATKLLVWVSVMQLWEQEQIDLETDIREYLPDEFLTNLKYDTPITMLNLMNHNAGFQEVYADLFVREHDAIQPLGDTLLVHEPEQIYEPGTVTAYSNWGVALAAYIVEQISGENFDDYVHHHIFEPLGMKHSALSVDLSDNIWVQEKRKELQCYTTEGELIPDCFYYITLYPAGMCTSTLADFETFGKALLNESSVLFEERETWQELFTATAYLGDGEVPCNYHGFWVVPYGVETVGHGGNTAGCSSYLLLDLQSEVGVVVMTNQSNESVYNSEMMEMVFGEFSEQNYFQTERSVPEGIYRPARTVRSGPFKMISLSFMNGEVESDEFWMTGTSGGVEKICYPYGDWVRVPFWEFVLEIILVILWVVALLFSVVSLLVKMVRRLVKFCSGTGSAIPLERWSTMAALVQIVTVVLFAVMASRALNYALASSYTWMTVILGLMIILMIGIVVHGIALIRESELTRLSRLYNGVTVMLLATSVANIVYWNLSMGWKI